MTEEVSRGEMRIMVPTYESLHPSPPKLTPIESIVAIMVCEAQLSHVKEAGLLRKDSRWPGASFRNQRMSPTRGEERLE